MPAKPQAKPTAAAAKKTKTPGAIPHFPRIQAPRPVERMVMTGNQPPKFSHPLHIITCNGVLLEISPRSQDAADAKAKILPTLEYRHEILHADGRRVLVEKRNAN